MILKTIRPPKEQFPTFSDYYKLSLKELDLPRLGKYLTFVFPATFVLGYYQWREVLFPPMSAFELSLTASFLFSAIFLGFYWKQRTTKFEITINLLDDHLQLSTGRKIPYRDFRMIKRIGERSVELTFEPHKLVLKPPTFDFVTGGAKERDELVALIKLKHPGLTSR